MKIEFNENELKSLAKLIYLADFVVDMGSDELAEDDYDNFQVVIDKIYRTINNSPLREMVEPVAGDEYEASEALLSDPGLNGIIENYENTSFWDRLVEMLAMRDIVEKMEWDEFNNLKPAQRAAIIDEQVKKYFQEFEEHGVNRLRIVE